MAIDYGTVFQRGLNTAIQGQPQTFGANVQNITGYKDILDFYRNQLLQGPSEQELSDEFNRRMAEANITGRASSPATLLQNVMGVDAYRRGVRSEGAQGLFGAIGNQLLNPVQPGQSVQNALGAEQFNEQMAFQSAMQPKRPSLGSKLGQLGFMAAGAVAPSFTPRGNINPMELASLRFAGAGAGADVGRALFQ